MENARPEAMLPSDWRQAVLAGRILLDDGPTPVIIRDGMRRMYANREDNFYYITLYNENYPMPAMPEGVQDDLLRGLYRFADDGARREQLDPTRTVERRGPQRIHAAQHALARPRRK